jgi:hypothetical protein
LARWVVAFLGVEAVHRALNASQRPAPGRANASGQYRRVR